VDDLRAIGLVIGLLSSVLGCGHFRATDATEADIKGTITQIQRKDVQRREKGVIGSILIEGVMEEDTKFDRAFTRITDKTRIFEQRGGDRRPATFDALAIGQRVEARFTGPVMQSHPVQAEALEIVILESEK
jgi:beta-N-acetylhexosaminidase